MELFTSNANSIHAIAQDIVALLAITNPLGAVPVFLGIIEGISLPNRRRAAIEASLGVALFGTLAGSRLPFILRRLGLDPASASAPFVATLVDVSGLIMYFTVAGIMLTGVLR